MYEHGRLYRKPYRFIVWASHETNPGEEPIQNRMRMRKGIKKPQLTTHSQVGKGYEER